MSVNSVDRLIQLFAQLPGLGPRSARRAVLHLIKQQEKLMLPLAAALKDAAASITVCERCGNIDTTSPCGICSNPKRDPAIICVVEEVADLWAFERNNIFNGTYHVLGGTLSAIDGIGPDELRIGALIARASAPEVKEVIIATNATVDGQTTAHYITDRLRDAQVTITQLAQGIPIGAELDYMDEGTLSAALKSRKAV